MTDDRKDAERYRALRDQGLTNWSATGKPYVVVTRPDGTAWLVEGAKLDRLIDSVLKEPA